MVVLELRESLMVTLDGGRFGFSLRGLPGRQSGRRAGVWMDSREERAVDGRGELIYGAVVCFLGEGEGEDEDEDEDRKPPVPHA
jgi:hypothetical protein